MPKHPAKKKKHKKTREMVSLVKGLLKDVEKVSPKTKKRKTGKIKSGKAKRTSK